MVDSHLLYELALQQTEGVGSVLYRLLVNTFGSASETMNAPQSKIASVPNVGPKVAARIKDNSESLLLAEKMLLDCKKNNIQICNFKSELYPKKLKSIFDAPPIVYIKGKGELNAQRTLAVVGTREATTYGKDLVDNLVANLAKFNVQIISGLAYGIDIAAHKAALKYGMSTIAVLANSLEGVYPEAHFNIAKDIQQNGYLISEQPVGTKTKQQFFVARNRIIAGLADVVLVVESAKKGGSMVTAQYANNYNRDVFAVPGNVFNKFSEGPNYLISSHLAQIFTTVDSFLEFMNWDQELGIERKVPKSEIDLSKFSQEESQVLALLVKNEEMLIDEISWQTQIHLNKLASILLNLEFQDMVKQLPGKKFKLKV